MDNKIIIAALLLMVVAVLGAGVAGFFLFNIAGDETTSSTDQSNREPVIESNDREREEMMEMENEEDSSTDTDQNAQAGAYIDYSESALTSQDNVIFFHASWCPTCKALDRAINEDIDQIPSDLTILKVDYDTANELRKKYGVTYQHTLVQVDEEGNEINKWTNSYTLDDILENIK